METPAGAEPEVFEVYRGLLFGMELRRLPRHQFYEAARAPDVALAVATGDMQHYANLMLTVGVL